MDNSEYSVYMHKFPNGKIYIGITMQSVEARWQKGHGYDRSDIMRNAIKKYGWENILHEVIADGLSREDACQMEIDLIKKYKSNKRGCGYNIESGGQCSPLAPETRKKISDSHIGKRASEETRAKQRESRRQFLDRNPEYYSKNRQLIEKATKARVAACSKPILQYDLDGKFIAKWSSAREASRNTGATHSNIIKCCRHTYKQSNGYRWEYADQ